MKKPINYNLTPARGQALLNFQGRIFPKSIELFETELIEEVRQSKEQNKELLQSEVNNDFKNILIHGDCLSACAYLKSQNIKVDLVYIDPPFASGANYAKKIYLRNGSKDSVENKDSIGEEIMYGDIWQKEDYLNWIYERLQAIREIMAENTSIYIHLDWHIGHYVKVLLDEIFGEYNFKNEIVWHYRTGNIADKAFQKKHDVIFLYTKGENSTFIPQEIKEYYFCIYGPDFKPSFKGRESGEDKYGEYRISFLDDVWDISAVFTLSKEHADFNTQKPKALLKRILSTSSEKGMVVADFFSGSGTTAITAHNMGRKFIACDVGNNAIQTTRDRLVDEGAEFDILKINDGIRLFRNPTQTTAKIFKLIDGFKTRTDLGLGDFWDGGIVDNKGEYIPVKFIQIHDRLTKELIDVLLEEIYQLQDVSGSLNKVKVLYAHIDPEINQTYVNKEIKSAGKTTVSVDLVSLDDLLGEKADSIYMPDSVELLVEDLEEGCTVKIKRFFSPYLKAKIDEYNSREIKKKEQTLNEENVRTSLKRKINISNEGLELIEAVQFDITLRNDGIWSSNIDLEDKAGVKEKIKAIYQLPVKKFRMKIRNISGDEIIIDSAELQRKGTG